LFICYRQSTESIGVQPRGADIQCTQLERNRVMIEVTKEQLDALSKEAFDLENKADCLRQNLIDLQWKIDALMHPEKEAE